MTAFVHDDFLLTSAPARRLYHDWAAGLPIVDYHCHLDPGDLAADRRFTTLTELWIAGDPYKHRAMRIAGVPERDITGPASDREKFDRWAATVPQTLGNPLFAWTALELKRYFDLDLLLTPATADAIWNAAQQRLPQPAFSARQLLARRSVECVCTSDRLLDDLAPHHVLAADGGPTRVRPSLRADDLLAIEGPDFDAWLQALARSTGVEVQRFDGFCAAVEQRLEHFDRLGCRLADHALDVLQYAATDVRATARLFERRSGGVALPADDAVRLKSGLLGYLGRQYARRGWILQLHLGALRQTSSRLRQLAGPAGGYAGIGATCNPAAVAALLDDLERDAALPRTILYTLNPADNAALAVLTGSFAEDDVRGKIQFGPAWWYNDHFAGIVRHLEDLASYGLLATFIGMTTDSRSLLSMVRHEFFRRVLCQTLGQWIERGLLPGDLPLVGEMVRGIAYENPRRAIAGA